MSTSTSAEETYVPGERFRSEEKYTTLRGIEKEAQRQLSPKVWNYLWCGTGDEVTLARNSAKFDELLFEAPLFTGVANPDTRTTFLDSELSLPLFTAPFGQEAVFHPDGHLAVGRAAEAAGVDQMVPVAASYRLEDVAAASSRASVFQLTFVGEQQDVLDMAERAKAAGYRYLCATFSPIRQWRERLREDRFVARSASDHVNFGPGGSSMAPLEELLEFTRPRWTWQQAAELITDAPLPVLVKGVHSARDAETAMNSGAVGLYVSNYGARTIDRTASTIEVLPEIRQAVGADVPIVLDSGVRRGSDIAAALALGADAVAIGRLTALGLAADGEYGVRKVLELLGEELWMTLGHLGCSNIGELSPHVFRTQPAR